MEKVKRNVLMLTALVSVACYSQVVPKTRPLAQVLTETEPKAIINTAIRISKEFGDPLSSRDFVIEHMRDSDTIWARSRRFTLIVDRNSKRALAIGDKNASKTHITGSKQASRPISETEWVKRAKTVAAKIWPGQPLTHSATRQRPDATYGPGRRTDSAASITLIFTGVEGKKTFQYSIAFSTATGEFMNATRPKHPIR